MIKNLVLRYFKPDFTEALKQWYADVKRQEYSRGWEERSYNYEAEHDRTENAKNHAYDKLMEEIKSEEFIDKIVSRIKAKQIG